jgi:hypothetical protein
MTLTAEDYAEKFTRSRASRECNRCHTVLRDPARLCGMCEADSLEAIIRDLTADRPTCTLAVWKLRDRGLTGHQVIRIRREVLRGVRPYEVVKAIEGLSNWRAA